MAEGNWSEGEPERIFNNSSGSKRCMLLIRRKIQTAVGLGNTYGPGPATAYTIAAIWPR
jgi:hypothetical protein